MIYNINELKNLTEERINIRLSGTFEKYEFKKSLQSWSIRNFLRNFNN
jgi:hypothetical protein